MQRFVLAVLTVMWGALPASARAPHLEAERQKNFGVAYLEQELPSDAVLAFKRVVELVPQEALGYANLGLSYLRMSQADSAMLWLEQARQRDPDDVEVLLLIAEVHLWKGNWNAVMETAREALKRRPDSKFARYFLYRAGSAQRGNPAAQEIAAQEIGRLFDMAPHNPVVAAKYSRVRAALSDWEGVARAVEVLRPMASDVAAARRALGMIDKALAVEDARGTRRGLTILENVLRPTPRHKQALEELQAPVAGLPIMRFRPSFFADLARERPPEIPVRFVPLKADALPTLGKTSSPKGEALGSLDFADVDGDGREDLLTAFSGGKQGGLQVWRRTAEGWAPALSHGLTSAAAAARFVDFDSDMRFDIAALGREGLRLLRGDSTGVWRDVTAQAGLSPEGGLGLELIDTDNEGDLDLCVDGETGLRLWQNRLDGTFRDATGPSGLNAGRGVRQLLAVDLDDDLDTDLLVVDAEGRLRLFDNLRQGRFAEVDREVDTTACRSVLAFDFDNDGFLDLALVGRDGALRFQRNLGGRMASAVRIPMDGLSAHAAEAFDFDNDGFLDLALAGDLAGRPAAAVLRSSGDGKWEVRALERPPEGCVALGSTDLDGDGDLDLLALDGRGGLRGWRNEGGNANPYLRVRLQGLRTSGAKNNLYGVGNKVEIKAGLHYQMQFVRRQVTHFGLGAQSLADLLRVMWSNGVPQNRFRPAADQTILEPQVLKGSCPYLYCWDGERFVFVTDLLAAAPLGLQPAEGVIAPDNPRELMTIPADRIGQHYGEYVFQYTSELWETVYLDEVALWAVDHPAGIETFTDQRFLPPPYGPPRPILTRGRTFPVRAENTSGEEVTERLLAFDHRYPEKLRPRRYQGVVDRHALTLHFGDVRHLTRPLLILGCWIFWTDTSINVSMSQGTAVVPGPSVLEVWHPESGWRAVDVPFGLPNGKDKWAVFDLSEHLFAPDARVRLQTESQIYWDQAFLADAAPSSPHRITRLAPRAADLHYGGFNRLYRPTEDGPHLYDYSHKVYLPVWMDMTGMATRYGEVTELLTDSDDRFAIFTGGDEVTIRFDASLLPPLEPGWTRDFLFYSDGWEKDSDRNTVTGDRVEPLPFHAMSAYPYPSSEAYPDDEMHREYLERYNTRRLGPEAFRRFVKDYRGGELPPLPWELEVGVRGDHGGGELENAKCKM